MEYRNPILTASTGLVHMVRRLGHLACPRLLLALSVLALAVQERVAQTRLVLLVEVLVLRGPLEMLLTTMQTTGVVRIFFTLANHLLLNDLQDITVSKDKAPRARVLKQSLFSPCFIVLIRHRYRPRVPSRM